MTGAANDYRCAVTFDERIRWLAGLHAPKAGRDDIARMFLGRCAPGNGSSLLIRRSAFHQAGLFDESLPRGEDVDLWLRMLAASPGPCFVCQSEARPTDWASERAVR